MRRIAWAALALPFLGCQPDTTPTGVGTSLGKEAPLIAPAQNQHSAPALAYVVDPFDVVTLQLRPAEGSASQIYGPVLVRVGTRYPPSPCISAGPPEVFPVSVLAFCGIVQNPAGETLASGEFVTNADIGPVSVGFSLTYPPGPCRSFLLEGFIPNMPRAVQSPGRPDITASFLTAAEETVLGVAQSPGSPQGATNPGPPDMETDPGPPQACVVTVADILPGH